MFCSGICLLLRFRCYRHDRGKGSIPKLFNLKTSVDGWCEHGCSGFRLRYLHFGMDVLLFIRDKTWAYLWFGHECAVYRMRQNMDLVLVLAWMLLFFNALEHGHDYALGMDALFIACARLLLDIPKPKPSPSGSLKKPT